MKSFGRITVLVVCAALICGAVVSWRLVKVRGTERKLAEDARACRIRAEHGDANAQYDLAGMYYRGKGVPQDYAEAVGWYRKAADQENPKAQYGLGFMYHEGKGVPQDYNQAVSWWRKAADQGYAKSQYALGYAYFEGKEVPQDYTEAVRWYRKAADQGNAGAQYSLGHLYFQGNGVPQDFNEAVGWYRKAADQGHARAQSALGYAYSEGKGVPRDYVQSARWYRKAAKQGDEYAKRALGSMNVRLAIWSKISLSVAFLCSMSLLISSRGSIRNRQRRRVTLAGLLGLLWVGVDVWGYSHFGILQSLSAVNAFYFAKSLLSGTIVALLLPFVWPQGAKSVLRICGILFIGFNVYAAVHYDLRQIAACRRAFWSANALLIGMAITLAIILRTPGEETGGTQNGNGGIAPGTMAASGTKPLGI